jgi:hypothetical protein
MHACAVGTQGTGKLSSHYYMGIGLDPDTLQYVWAGDGTSAGNGEVSNANPYAHWGYAFPDTLTNNPTHTCTIGYSPYTYDTYTGDGSSAQMQNSVYFKSTTNKNK